MGDVVANPLGHHDSYHDRQQKCYIIGYLDLKVGKPNKVLISSIEHSYRNTYELNDGNIITIAKKEHFGNGSFYRLKLGAKSSA